MKKCLKSKYDWRYNGVELDQVSLCVPEQSLSIEEILRRFTQGTLLAADIERAPSYGEDICPEEDAEHMDPLYDPETDLVDIYEDASQAERLHGELQRKKTSERKKAKAAVATPNDDVPTESDEGEKHEKH